MIEKYGLQTKESRIKNQDRGKNPELETRNTKLKFCWLWYPYRWWVGVKGVFKLILAPNPLRGIRKKARSD
jgi:hypothetical protein